MKHVLPDLPYPIHALEPILSAEALEFHHGKHHKGYVDKLNQLIQGTEFQEMSLEEIIANSSGPIFNNAAQAWNHTFLWHSMIPQPQVPQGQFLQAIERDFGSLDQFADKFQKAAIDRFGSGWAWLVRNDSSDKLTIETTSNAENPLVAGKKPLLTCDVWEHAYYIDYRNERARYLQSFMKILNWEFAQRNFETPWAMAA